MEKTKIIISGIITFVIDLLFPVKKLLVQYLDDINKIQDISFQTHLYQLLVVYGFITFISFFGIYELLKLFEKKD